MTIVKTLVRVVNRLVGATEPPSAPHTWEYKGGGMWVCRNCPLRMYAPNMEAPDEWFCELFGNRSCSGRSGTGSRCN